MYIYSYLFCLYYCKDYCHRLTTQLQLVVVAVVVMTQLRHVRYIAPTYIIADLCVAYTGCFMTCGLYCRR